MPLVRERGALGLCSPDGHPVTWPFRPLSDTELREIAEVGPRYSGFAWEPSGAIGVDVLDHEGKPVRHRGERLRKALKVAKEAQPC